MTSRFFTRKNIDVFFLLWYIYDFLSQQFDLQFDDPMASSSCPRTCYQEEKETDDNYTHHYVFLTYLGKRDSKIERITRHKSPNRTSTMKPFDWQPKVICYKNLYNYKKSTDETWLKYWIFNKINEIVIVQLSWKLMRKLKLIWIFEHCCT